MSTSTSELSISEAMELLREAIKSIPDIVRQAVEQQLHSEQGPLLTREQLREALQTSESTLKRWDRQGCPRVDIGERSPRYRLDAVIAWRKAQAEQRKASAPVSLAVGIRPLSRRRR